MAFDDFHLSKNKQDKQKAKEQVIRPLADDQPETRPSAAPNDVESRPTS